MTQKQTRIINQLHIDIDAERQKLVAGLRANNATIEPKYFYDEMGCAIYGAICQLDEYYPTRTERAIFEANRQSIASHIGQRGTFIDLGAGDCAKALGWLPFIAAKCYVAVDIAGPSITVALTQMASDFPETALVGLVTDFSQTLSIPASLLTDKVTLFYPGSSIGNFTPDAAINFLRQMRAITAPNGGGLLIGVDAKKPKATLDAAYDDALGVTAAFNLNALRHINRLVGSDFNLSQWQHVGYYNEAEGRIEMHLASLVEQTVTIDGVQRHFAKGEKIHSENSYKYHRDEFEALLREAGFSEITCWSDDERAFWVFYAK
jgi:dimethylhistidine N-methyltransferase